MPKKLAKSSTTRSNRESIEDRFEDVADVETHMTVAIYGRQGSGKTTLFGTFPGPKLLIDCRDKGTDSVNDVKDLRVFRIEDLDDLNDAYWYLKENPTKFKSVALDTVSALQEMAVKHVAEKKKKNSARAGNWGTMTKQDWGEVAQIMKEAIMNFRDLPMNVCFIAQERVFNMDDDDDSDNILAPEVGPRLMPSVASVLNAAVNIIANCFIRQKEITKTDPKTNKKRTIERTVYCLRVGPNPVYLTKIRKPKRVELPDYLEDPTYDDIMEIVKGL